MSNTKEKMDSKLSANSKKLIEEIVKKFTDKDIKLIADSCYKIRSLNNKKNETRREFVTTFEKHHDTYRKVINTYNELGLETSNNGDSKKDALAYYVDLIRKRQENLGINSYLLNEVKFGFMKSIVKWIDTPGDLDKVSSSAKEDKKQIKKTTKKKITRIENKLSVSLDKKISSASQWQIYLTISNITRTPLQNIDLYFYNQENDLLEIEEAEGNYIVTDEKHQRARINFLEASMEENSVKESKFIIKFSKDIDVEDLDKIEAEIENPSKGEKETETFNVY